MLDGRGIHSFTPTLVSPSLLFLLDCSTLKDFSKVFIIFIKPFVGPKIFGNIICSSDHVADLETNSIDESCNR